MNKRNSPYASATNSDMDNSKDMDNDTAAVTIFNDFSNSYVSALLDSGNSITLMSKQLYEFLPSNVKSTLSS